MRECAQSAQQVNELQRGKTKEEGKKTEMKEMWTGPEKKEVITRIQQRHAEQYWQISQANAMERTINKESCPTTKWQGGAEKQRTMWKQKVLLVPHR